MNELNTNEKLTSRPATATYQIDFRDPANRKSMKKALTKFEKISQKIEQCKQNDKWEAPSPDEKPSQETCDICDLRWDCPVSDYKMRYP